MERLRLTLKRKPSLYLIVLAFFITGVTLLSLDLAQSWIGGSPASREAYGYWGDLQLRLELDRSTITEGEIITANLTLRNTSGKEYRVDFQFQKPGFDLFLYDSTGTLIYRWSDDPLFISDVSGLQLEPHSSYSLIKRWDLTRIDPVTYEKNSPGSGRYYLTGVCKGYLDLSLEQFTIETGKIPVEVQAPIPIMRVVSYLLMVSPVPLLFWYASRLRIASSPQRVPHSRAITVIAAVLMLSSLGLPWWSISYSQNGTTLVVVDIYPWGRGGYGGPEIFPYPKAGATPDPTLIWPDRIDQIPPSTLLVDFINGLAAITLDPFFEHSNFGYRWGLVPLGTVMITILVMSSGVLGLMWGLLRKKNRLIMALVALFAALSPVIFYSIFSLALTSSGLYLLVPSLTILYGHSATLTWGLGAGFFLATVGAFINIYLFVRAIIVKPPETLGKSTLHANQDRHPIELN